MLLGARDLQWGIDIKNSDIVNYGSNMAYREVFSVWCGNCHINRYLIYHKYLDVKKEITIVLVTVIIVSRIAW